VSFLIRNVPGGRMSGYLTGAAKPGDRMTLTGPLGTFYLRDIQRPLLLLAGGTGLAPFTAMLEKIATDGSPHPLHLIYGVTHDADLVEMDRLAEYAQRIPNFTLRRLRGQPRQRVPEQGLRHPPHHAGAHERRRRGRLPVRPAADGGGGQPVHPRMRCQAGQLPPREVRRQRLRTHHESPFQ
jgi:ferredoxin-NADP reductase